jgi:hypothetical protein
MSTLDRALAFVVGALGAAAAYCAVPGFQFVFGGLPESVEYYVSAGPLDSKHFNIHVLDLPNVKNVRVTYRYPSWTHLQNVTEERGGDLRIENVTPRGARVIIQLPLAETLSHPLAAAVAHA